MGLRWQFDTIAHAHGLLHSQHTQALFGKGDAYCTYATTSPEGAVNKDACIAANRDGWSLWVHYGDNPGMVAMGAPLNDVNAPQADKDASMKLIECVSGHDLHHLFINI